PRLHVLLPSHPALPPAGGLRTGLPGHRRGRPRGRGTGGHRRPAGPKPSTGQARHKQLAASSGREVVFHTAVCVIDHLGDATTHVDETRVRFRELSSEDIARYVERERPLDCAGSFKCEGLGISLFERIDNEDPTALVGLPLIATSRLLRAAGVVLP